MQSNECFICESRKHRRNGAKIVLLLLVIIVLVGAIGWCMGKGIL